MTTHTIIEGDVRDGLRSLPDNSVQMSVTSPPYFGLRDYGVDGQIGLEPSLKEYISNVVEVAREVRRVLRPDGVFFLNLGDCYAGSGKGPTGKSGIGDQGKRQGFINNRFREGSARADGVIRNDGQSRRNRDGIGAVAGLKEKDLMGVPWRVAFALQDEGWYLRQDLIWAKPNCMPSSVRDRCTTSHEYIFLLTKKPRYFWDGEAIREPVSASYANDKRPKGVLCQRVNVNTKYPRTGQYKQQKLSARGARPPGTRENNQEISGSTQKKHLKNANRDGGFQTMHRAKALLGYDTTSDGLTRNARSVWVISPQPRPEAHFACVDDQTEALTPNGWRNIHALKDHDLIVAFDGVKLSWQEATFHRYPFNGKMISVNTRDLSMWLTPNHRVVCRGYKDKGEWGIKIADRLKGYEEIPTAAQFDCPTNGKLINKEVAELAGWILTDGTYNRGNTISLYQTGGRDKHEKIEALFSTLKITPSLYRRDRGHGDERCYNFAGEVAEFIKRVFPLKEGNFGILATWNEGDLRALWRGMTEGDGSQRKDGRITFVGNRSKVDFYQALCVRLGMTCRISPKGSTGNSFAAFVGKKKSTSLRGTNGTQKTIQNDVWYDGIVWCPHVQSGMWLARRNGRPFITGNTFPDELARRCIKAGSSERGCCPACGAPYRRIIVCSGGTTGKSWTPHNDDLGVGAMCGAPTTGYRREFRGWEPTCKCDAGEPVPCTVLDPFMGSGTVACIARDLGRNSIGCELNPEYIAIARRRLRADEQIPEGGNIRYEFRKALESIEEQKAAVETAAGE